MGVWSDGYNVSVDVRMTVAQYELLLAANDDNLSLDKLFEKLIDDYLKTKEVV